jgi:hypothetical protein
MELVENSIIGKRKCGFKVYTQINLQNNLQTC